MNLFSWSDESVLLTLLAQRVSLDVSVTDSFPSTTISYVGLWVSLKLIVMLVCYLFMLATVLLSIITEPTATAHATRTFRFHWHKFHLRFCIRKALAGLLPRRLFEYFFTNTILTYGLCVLK